jgi:hypothetical protein
MCTLARVSEIRSRNPVGYCARRFAGRFQLFPANLLIFNRLARSQLKACRVDSLRCIMRRENSHCPSSSIQLKPPTSYAYAKLRRIIRCGFEDCAALCTRSRKGSARLGSAVGGLLNYTKISPISSQADFHVIWGRIMRRKIAGENDGNFSKFPSLLC